MSDILDISSLSIQDSTTFPLLHPVTGEAMFADKAEKLPITITVASTASKAYRTAVNAMMNRSNQRKRQGKKELTPDQQREEGLELLVACCLGSENLVYKGNSVDSTNDFRVLLSDDKMSWIKTQIDENLGNIENFIEKSLTA